MKTWEKLEKINNAVLRMWNIFLYIRNDNKYGLHSMRGAYSCGIKSFLFVVDIKQVIKESNKTRRNYYGYHPTFWSSTIIDWLMKGTHENGVCILCVVPSTHVWSMTHLMFIEPSKRLWRRACEWWWPSTMHACKPICFGWVDGKIMILFLRGSFGSMHVSKR